MVLPPREYGAINYMIADPPRLTLERRPLERFRSRMRAFAKTQPYR